MLVNHTKMQQKMLLPMFVVSLTVPVHCHTKMEFFLIVRHASNTYLPSKSLQSLPRDNDPLNVSAGLCLSSSKSTLGNNLSYVSKIAWQTLYAPRNIINNVFYCLFESNVK